MEYGKQKIMHSLLVVEGAGPRQCFAVQHMSLGITLGDPLSKHDPLFQSKLGEAKNIAATFFLEQQVTPRFCNARTVPCALREKMSWSSCKRKE